MAALAAAATGERSPLRPQRSLGLRPSVARSLAWPTKCNHRNQSNQRACTTFAPKLAHSYRLLGFSKLCANFALRCTGGRASVRRMMNGLNLGRASGQREEWAPLGYYQLNDLARRTLSERAAGREIFQHPPTINYTPLERSNLIDRLLAGQARCCCDKLDPAMQISGRSSSSFAALSSRRRRSAGLQLASLQAAPEWPLVVVVVAFTATATATSTETST